MFRRLEGTLMQIAASPDTQFLYTVWFDYTREAINEIYEGIMLAVPNFGSDPNTQRWSILEVTGVMPSHFALQGGNTGYPGFVEEAALSAAQDWVSQDKESTEETTKIIATAVPTFLEIIEPELYDDNYDESTINIGPESNMAMVGSKVRALDSKTTNLVANNGIDTEEEENITTIGTLARDPDVEILMRVDELLRTHFAIFGFTGVGKSNLLSTIVAKIFESTEEPVKLVFFDLMGEYTGLLIDQLLSDDIDGRLLAIGRNTLPEGTFKYINDLVEKPRGTEAARQLLRYTLLPKALQGERRKIGAAFLEFLHNEKVRYFNEAQSVTVYDLFFTDEVVTWARQRQQALRGQRMELTKKVLRECNIGRSYTEARFTPALAKKIREKLLEQLNQPENSQFQDSTDRPGDYAHHISKLEELERSTAEVFAASTTLPEIIDDLNDATRHSLWIIQSHSPDDLREFSHNLGSELYESRRLTGAIDPLVSFIFDEADEFIRSQRGRTGTYEKSAAIAETVARRGRKFGIGLGIATQRIRYLDTNIMSQPHTYFISKLPRASDRTAVAEAFGFGDDMLNQTFKFVKGQWLLVSHDATGLESVPLPVKTMDANRRVSDFLKERYGDTR